MDEHKPQEQASEKVPARRKSGRMRGWKASILACVTCILVTALVTSMIFVGKFGGRIALDQVKVSLGTIFKLAIFDRAVGLLEQHSGNGFFHLGGHGVVTSFLDLGILGP